MQKICTFCKQPSLDEINLNNRKAYKCSACGKISTRFLEKHSEIVSLQTSAGLKHITVGALIYNEEGKILMTKRRVWPYVYDFPAGHLEYNENPDQAIRREITEETGLIVKKTRLLFHGDMQNDKCRYGADTHEWYFFQCEVENFSGFQNSELESIYWLDLDQIKKLKLLPAARYFADNIINIDVPSLSVLYLPIYHKEDSLISEEKQSELLYHISSSLLTIENPANILEVAAEETLNATNLESISFFMYDHQADKMGKKVVRSKLAHYRPANDDIVLKCKLLHKSIMLEKDNKRLLAIPMITNSEILGILLAEISEKQTFAEKETQFLMILANEISVGLANAQLIETTKKENNLLSSVIENSGEGIVVTDDKGKILMMNSYLEEILGMKKKDLQGTAGLDFSQRIGAFSYVKKVIQALHSKNTAEQIYDELEIAIPNSEKNWFSLVTSFIRDSEGATINTVNMFRNITAEKKLIQAKNDLITTATHELRTPLTAIKGYLSMIKDTDLNKMDEKQIKYLDKASASTERLVNLVEDLLSALKIDENKVNPELIDFDLNNVILESIHNLKSKAQVKKIQIKYDSSQIFAHGDPVKSKHIIENLLDNAIKYTPASGMIAINAKDQIHNVQIAVKDTGVGIPQKYSSMIFDKFIRVNNPLSVKAGGTGLGLYIAKNLVERQGGRIWLESKQQKGTTFYFTIPSSTLFTQQNNI